MLKLLRRKKIAKRIFYCLAAIVIPAFVIWGSASVINKSKAPNFAGIIFGKKISFDDFRQALHAWKMQLKLQYGDKSEQIATTLFNPIQATWDRLILLHEARQRGIKITDEEVIAAITHLPFLQRNGRFEPQIYELFLKYSLVQEPRIFEEQLRESLAIARLFQQVTNSVSISVEEIRKEYEQQNVRTRIQYVSFPANGYKNQTPVTDEEVKAYYDKEKEKFKIPPQINVAYIHIELKEDAPEDERVKASEKLKSALSLAKAGDFQEAGRELNLNIKETGLFGFEDPIPELGWMPQISNLLFSLSLGSISPIVETSRGIHLFKIKEKNDAYIPDFKEVRDKVKDALLNEKSKEIALQKATDFISKVRGATTKKLSLKEAAEQEGLQIKETPLFSIQDYIPELGMAQPLKDVAFKLKPDMIADKVIELEQGFYVIESVETQSVDEEKFKEEKGEFAQQLLEEKRNKVFDEYFQDLRQRANLISYIDDSKPR